MAGGLFGTPLELNPKCLVFTVFVLLVYWMPHFKAYEHRIVMNVILGITAYVLMAWYDKLYDCTDRYGPTFFGWLSMPFKPHEYRDKFEALPVKYKKLVRIVDIVILIVLLGLVFSPFFLSGTRKE